MEVPSSEDDGFIREWAPYTNFLNKIPARFLNGLFSSELNFTSIDAIDEYLAIGTNAGFVYWSNRNKHDIQKLKCENTQEITFVKILSTVDFMVAAGNKVGQVTIFQIPKEHPASVPESLKPKVERKIERFTVGELHKGEISFIEWSKNGMKLFSGDKNGIIVCTEIDFYMHLCKSVEIVNETYEIVQISYYQKSLLVSSVYRTIVCSKKDSKWSVSQVGKKERKSLCRLGSVFSYNYKKPSEVTVFCSRPGLRIWKSDIEGNVQQTLLFKDAITNPCGIVELLNPAMTKTNLLNKEYQFGPIFVLKDNFLVTYNEDFLYILDPRTLQAIAVVDSLRRITSLAVNKDEIFILEGERSIIRLAYSPENEYILPVENVMTKSLSNTLQQAVETMQNLAHEAPALILSSLMDRGDLKQDFDNEMIFHAEECFELPPVKDLPFEIEATIEQCSDDRNVSNKNGGNLNGLLYNIEESESFDNPDDIKQKTLELQKKLELYQMINEKEYDKKLIYRSKRNKKNDIHLQSEISSLRESVNTFRNETDQEDDKTDPSRPSLLNLSAYNDKSLLLPDCSPGTLEKEIEDKEKLLAKILNLEPITIVSPSSYLPKENLIFNNRIEKDGEYFRHNLNDVEIENSPVKKIDAAKKMSKRRNEISVIIDSLPNSVSIPNTWNLRSIEIESVDTKSTTKEINLSQSPIDDDWEIV